ncbi:hypothetical protein EC973_006447 [Apophysomyces ossiformis]|uniref:PH domain-containing protein n=1 Tax=Apophysomyces ossiformis TaxID=679940 RepID=A0A8H7ESD1_9FUNG|nr:hypothetical protein EC973_006447 [Apophysomyces ossiformis]
MLPLLYPEHPTNPHEKEVQLMQDELTAKAIANAKSILRRSVASQCSTATSLTDSQRHSFSSEDNNHPSLNDQQQTRRWSAESGGLDKPSSSSFSSLPPSSRLLLSGATSSESFRQQELNRFLPPSSRHLKALSDPFVHTPFSALAANIDPWCMSAKLALDHAVCSDWLHKHNPSSFAFGRSWKRRFVAIVNRTVYIFKSEKPTVPAHEHFLLTEDTMVFVSEKSKKGFVLELRKPLCQWHLRCSSVAQMKDWLETMKKIVGCAKLSLGGTITKPLLDSVQLTDDHRILKLTNTAEQKASLQQQNHPSLRRNTSAASQHHQRRSLADIPDWEKILPPPLPPPKIPLPSP